MPISGLRFLNKFVNQIIRDSDMQIPRQDSIQFSRGTQVIGSTSSFGMSGTNAHAIVSGIWEEDNTETLSEWKRRSYWPTFYEQWAYCFWLLSETSRILDIDFTKPCLHFLKDHVVQSTPILPGCGMFDIAALLTQIYSTSQGIFAITHGVIYAPVILSNIQTMRCNLSLSTGEMTLNAVPSQASPNFRSYKSPAIDMISTRTGNKSRKNVLNLVLSEYSPSIAFVEGCSWEDRTAAITDSTVHLSPMVAALGVGSVQVDQTLVVALAEGYNPPRRQKGDRHQTSAIQHAEGHNVVTNHLTSHLMVNVRFGIHNLVAKPIRIRRPGKEDLRAEGTNPVSETKSYAIQMQSKSFFKERTNVWRDKRTWLFMLLQTGRSFISIQSNSFQTKMNAEFILCLKYIEMYQIAALQPRSVHSAALHGVLESTSAAASQGSVAQRQCTIVTALRSLQEVFSKELPLMTLRSVFQSNFGPDTLLHGQEDLETSCAAGLLFTRQLLTYYQKEPKILNESFWFPRKTMVLITGGTGALGSLISTWVSRLGIGGGCCMVGRTGRLQQQSFLHEISEAVGIECIKMDVSSKEEVQSLFQKANNSSPISSIMHAGAVLDSKLLPNISLQSANRIYSGKVFGGIKLSDESLELPITCSQLFSSIAAFGGVPGQGVYASANGMLDGMAVSLQTRGRSFFSVQWGNWGGGGMAANDDLFLAMMQRMGLGLIPPAEGLQSMQRMLQVYARDFLSNAVPVFMVNVFYWKRIIPALGVIPDILSSLLSEENIVVPLETQDMRRPNRELSDIPDIVWSVVRKNTLVESMDDSFMDAGMDSSAGEILRRELTSALGRPLPATLFFDHPTPRDLIESFFNQQGGSANNITGETKVEIEDDESVMGSLRTLVREISGADIGLDDPLMASGVDSMSSTRISQSVSTHYGLNASSTLIIDYPSIREIARYISRERGSSAQVTNANRDYFAVVKSKETASNTEHLIIRAVTYRFPDDKLAIDLSLDIARTIPLNRWDIEAHYSTNIKSK